MSPKRLEPAPECVGTNRRATAAALDEFSFCVTPTLIKIAHP